MKNGAAGFPAAPVLPIAARCGRSRLKFSRSSFPADEATSRCREVRACPQRVFVNGRLLRSLRLRVAEERFVGQLHLLPGTLLPQRNFLEQCGQSVAKKYSNGLPWIETTQAELLMVARTSSPRDPAAL